MHFDLILQGGTVVDGTGAAARRADVGVLDGLVNAVGALPNAAATEILDVTGRVVAPGFIDVHSHSDLAVFLPKDQAEVKLAGIRQGVTTEVCGNCGLTPFPRTPRFAAMVDRNVSGAFPAGSPTFDSLVEYREALDRMPLVSNLAPLLGHGSLRGAVMGFADRAPRADELRDLERLTEEAMDQGAFGLSSGLIYPPGVYASAEEITALARIAGRYGRPYTTHMRDESDRVTEALAEALQVGRDANVAVQVSHHKLGGQRNWGRSQQTLAMIEGARDEGVDVALDVYPYTAGSTMLRAILPPWANDGGVDLLLERLRDGSVRDRIARDFEFGLPGWQDFVRQAGWAGIVIASAPSHTELEGLSVAAIAAATGQSAVEAVADLLVAEAAGVIVLIHLMDLPDVAAIDDHPLAMLGSDGIPLPGRQHPRLAGAFARGLQVSRDRNGLGRLPDRIRRMTSLPASRFGVPDRGIVRAGLVADLVVFDSETVRSPATYADPLLRPTGVDHVVVGGAVVIRNGADAGPRVGRVLEPR